MLVENTLPQTRTIEKLNLMPGFNRVSDETWERLTHEPAEGEPINKWRKPVLGLVKSGIIKVETKNKLTVEIIQNTYDIELLNSWLDDSKNKGRIKGAIREQLKIMEAEEGI